MTVYISLCICIAIMVGILFFYLKTSKLLERQTADAQKEVDSALDVLKGVVPGVDDGSVLLIYLDRVSLILYMEEEAARKAGFDHHVWTLLEFRELCHTDCLDVLQKWTQVYARTYHDVLRRLRFHLTLDGGKTYQWWEMIYKLEGSMAKERIFPAMMINIDSLKAQENSLDDLRQSIYSVEMRETQLAAINHDLRTPLNSIAGFGTLLAEQYDDFSPEERKEFAEIISSNSKMMLKLLEDVQNTSQTDISNIRFKLRDKHVKNLVNTIYKTNSVICPSQLDFLLEIPEGCDDVLIHVDPKRVEQVANNFLSNSFKFTAIGSVTLGLKMLQESGEVEIYVRDTGVGITKENQAKLFDQFFKINEHAHGTGLGLNNCKKIVEKLDGTLGVESEFGHGSTFYCRFKTVAPSA